MTDEVVAAAELDSWERLVAIEGGANELFAELFAVVAEGAKELELATIVVDVVLDEISVIVFILIEEVDDELGYWCSKS
jgi:hypothetical protein